MLNIEFKKAELISNSFLSTLFNMMNDLLQHLVGVQFFFTFCWTAALTFLEQLPSVLYNESLAQSASVGFPSLSCFLGFGKIIGKIIIIYHAPPVVPSCHFSYFIFRTVLTRSWNLLHVVVLKSPWILLRSLKSTWFLY